NVPVTPGLANALPILRNAARSRSPVLLTAGQQDTRLLVHEPILAGDLVKMAEPFTKWAYEIRSADEAVSVLGRAVTIALTPPTGPVFLSLPMDLMTDETDAPAPRTQGPSAQRPGIPGMADVTRACGLLAGARAPLIIAGDGVGRAPDGVAALTRLAEALGARVYGEPIYRRTNFPGDHSLWRGGLYPSVPVVRKTLDDADVILIVGADVFTWFLHGPGAPFRPGVPVIQLADDSRQIGRSYPVDLAFAAAITPTLRLIRRLEAGDARLGDGRGDRRAARRSAAQGRRDDRRRIGDVRAAGLVDGRSRGLADHLRRGEQHVLRDPQGGHGNARPGWSQDGFLPGHGPHRARGGLRAPRRIAGRPGRTRREAG